MKEHTAVTRVLYGQTDQMGVVYHANYLHFFELGRTELLRAAGLPYADLEKRGVFLVVTETGCRYRSGARYDETLRISTRVAALGKATVRFEYSVIADDGRLVAEGHTELATVNASRKPIRLPGDVASLLA